MPGYSFEVFDTSDAQTFSDLKGAKAVRLSCAIKVELSELAASNNLDVQSDAVRGAFGATVKQLVACHQRSRRDPPAAPSPVKVSLVIAPNGQVTGATATAADTALADCVADVAKKASFPQQPGDRAVTVTYELRFTDPSAYDCRPL